MISKLGGGGEAWPLPITEDAMRGKEKQQAGRKKLAFQLRVIVLSAWQNTEHILAWCLNVYGQRLA